MRAMLGRNVKNARMPNPTGFGFGSEVMPSFARRITTSKGPVPAQNTANPIQNRFNILNTDGSAVFGRDLVEDGT